MFRVIARDRYMSTTAAVIAYVFVCMTVIRLHAYWCACVCSCVFANAINKYLLHDHIPLPNF